MVVVDADRQASAAEWLEERPIDGVEVIEAPSERTLARAMNADEGTVVVDLPPGDERLVQSAIAAADAVVIPTRAGGVEFARVAYTLGMIPSKTPRGIVITAARFGTNDLQETIDWWKGESVPIWGCGSGTRRHRRRTRRHGCIAMASTNTPRCSAASSVQPDCSTIHAPLESQAFEARDQLKETGPPRGRRSGVRRLAQARAATPSVEPERPQSLFKKRRPGSPGGGSVGRHAPREPHRQ